MSELVAVITEKDGGKVLQIQIPLQKATPSGSGKTLVVATTNGNKKTDNLIDGQHVFVGVNAYIKPPEAKAA